MLSLFDILHEVPLILDLMPSNSLAALVAVSRAHRRQVHNHVSKIAIPDHDHIQTLFRGVWPRLQFWQMGDRLQLFPEGTYSGSIDSEAAVLRMKSMTLCEGSMTAAHMVAQLHDNSCSTLQSCWIKKVGISTADLQSFCSHTSPALLQLNLPGYRLDTEASSHLAAASWPCLTTLDLRSSRLKHAALQQLSSGYWPAVTHLNVSGNNLGTDSISLLAQPLGPARNMTDWAAQLTVLDLSDDSRTPERSLTASVIEELTKIYWPCLENLYLRRLVPSLDVMSHLVHGRWPKLSALDIRGTSLQASELQMLAQAPRMHLRHLCLTANLQDAAVSEQFLTGSEAHDQQLLRYVQLQAQPGYIIMQGRSSALSCLQGLTYMQLPKCFAEWLGLCVHVSQVPSC